MSNIRILNNISLYNTITAASGVTTPEIDGINNQLLINPDPYSDTPRHLIVKSESSSGSFDFRDSVSVTTNGGLTSDFVDLKLGSQNNFIRVADLGTYIEFNTGLVDPNGDLQDWLSMGAGQPWYVTTEDVGLPGSPEYRNILALPNNSHIYGGVPNNASGNTTWHGSLSVTGNLNIAGSAVFHNTEYTTTSAISVTNTGTGPALVVTQTGEQAIAAFYDDTNIALYIDGTTAKPGYVGIGTENPNVKLTVIGDISASGTIYGSSTINKFVSTFGNGSSLDYTIDHNLGVQDVVVSIVDTTTQEVVYPLVTNTAMNQITVSFAEAPALTAYKAIIIG